MFLKVTMMIMVMVMIITCLLRRQCSLVAVLMFAMLVVGRRRTKAILAFHMVMLFGSCKVRMMMSMMMLMLMLMVTVIMAMMMMLVILLILLAVL
jgi:hypothetical protein